MIDYAMIIGQTMGIIAVILGFVSFQMRTRKQLMIVQIATAITFCIHYGLIGATSGMMMNILSTLRNLCYYYKDKKIFSGWKCPIFFSVLMLIAGILTWQDFYSIFVLMGLVINTICMALTDPQSIRKSILVTSPMVIAYDAFVMSVGGIIYESVAIISSIIGIIRYRKDKA